MEEEMPKLEDVKKIFDENKEIKQEELPKDENTIYYDGYLRSNLDYYKIKVSKGYDCIVVIDGREGTGKSTLGIQTCLYFDRTFNVNRICWSGEEFERIVWEAKEEEAIMFDEATEGLYAQEWWQDVNRTIVKMLKVIRFKKLYIILICPTFFDLNKSIAVHRADCLLHTYFTNEFDRGQFTFFNYNKKVKLYVLGRRFYDYYLIPANFFGRFYRNMPFNWEEYQKKKIDALKKAYGGKGKAIKGFKYHTALVKAIKTLRNAFDMNDRGIAEALGLSIHTIRHLRQRNAQNISEIEGFAKEIEPNAEQIIDTI